jgi:hypothetical protein
MGDFTKQDMIDALKEAGFKGSGNSGPSSGFGAAQSIELATVAFGKVGGAAEAVALGFGKVSGVIGDNLDAWKKSSAIGVNFGHDMVGLTGTIMQTRMTSEEFNEVLKTNIKGFTAFGGGMNESARNFAKLSTEFANTDAADKMRLLGYNTAEYNNLLALNVTTTRQFNLADKQGREDARKSTESLAYEMDKVAQLTGISRKEQETAMKERQSNARLQQALDLEIRKGGATARDDFNKMAVSLQKSGLDKVGAELYTGQPLTEEAIATMNAIGPAGTELRNAINGVKEASKSGNEQEKKLALDRLNRANDAAALQLRSDSNLQLGASGMGKVAEAQGKAYLATQAYELSIENTMQAKKMERDQAIKFLDEEASRAQKGKTLNEKGQEVDIAGAKTTELTIKSMARVKDGLEILGKTLVETNERISGSSVVNRATAAVRNERPATSAGIYKPGTPIGYGEAGGLLGEGATKTPGLIRQGENVEAIKATASSIGSQIVNGLKTGKDILMGGNSEGTRDAGTFGMTGQMFEPKDFIGKIQKGETVFTPGQLQEYSQGLFGQFQKSNFTGLGDIKATISSAMPALQKQIETPVTPVSTGKATLDDVVERLEYLNKTMGQLASHSESIADQSAKTARATKRLDPNVSLR